MTMKIKLAAWYSSMSENKQNSCPIAPGGKFFPGVSYLPTSRNDGEFCVSKKTRQGPVWFCEEFDDYVPVKEQEVHEAGFQPTQSRVGFGIMENDSLQFKGLCINCENGITCINSKTEGGIWHCEEYC